MTTDSVAEALRDSVRDVLARESDSARLHQFVDGGRLHDEALWREAAALGWTALAVPEAFEGLALSAVETAAVCEELGRFLAPVPLLGSMLTVRALTLGGSATQQARWLAGLASGALKGAIAAPAAERGTPAPLARRTGDQLVIEGVAANVLQGGEADILILPVRLETGESAFVAVEPARDGATLTVEATQDRTRHLARLQMSGLKLPLDRLLNTCAAADLSRALQAEADLALAADSVGGGEAIFERTLDYLKTREQFGKPIGSFQALKHRCADHKVALAASAAVVREAARLRR
jgi:alkylation response protein AidB-like acyl-CoA dehydrogenase